MIEIVLFEPEIPPNTGNVIRLAANCGAPLHLVRPLGFTLDDARMRRAGLDYHEFAQMQVHDNFEALRAARPDARILAYTRNARTRYTEVHYRPGDLLLFGPETRGLPRSLLDTLPEPQHVALPQRPGMRSLNLSNAVAVAAYEAWRQLDFNGAAPPPSGL